MVTDWRKRDIEAGGASEDGKPEWWWRISENLQKENNEYMHADLFFIWHLRELCREESQERGRHENMGNR